MNPVIIDENGNIIDGHIRRDICDEIDMDWHKNATIKIGLSDIQKKALAIELNFWRRSIHLTRAKRNELIDIYLLAHSELSESQIAELFGVSQPTIHRRRKRLIQMNKFPKPTETIDKNGVKRKVPQKKTATLVVKSKNEFDKLKPNLSELSGELSGLIRKPGTIKSKADRKRNLAKVKPTKTIPANIELHQCDFRNLPVKPGTVDLILTDVVWGIGAKDDWLALAECAKKWLKPEGLFVSLIGSMTMPDFLDAVRKHLNYQHTGSMVYPIPRPMMSGDVFEQWRPFVIASRMPEKLHLGIVDTLFPKEADKQYDDWQQPLSVAAYLTKELSKPGALIVDPHLGTGTNSVACNLIAEGRRFIGCDIEERKVKIARHRLATETTYNSCT